MTDTSYVLLPQFLLMPPVVRRRSSTDKQLLRPIEIAIAAALLRLAHQEIAHSRHVDNFENGARFIAEEIARGRRAREVLRVAGSAGYSINKGKAQSIDRRVLVRTSRRNLLVTGKLFPRGCYFQELLPILDRLSRRVRGTPSPLLDNWRPVRDGLELEIDARWLRPPFQKVPLPIPLREQTLALFLFLHAVNTSPLNQRGMPFDRLCPLLGISSDHRSRDLTQALAGVNAHIRRLPNYDIDRYLAQPEGSYVKFSRRLRDIPEFSDEE